MKIDWLRLIAIVCIDTFLILTYNEQWGILGIISWYLILVFSILLTSHFLFMLAEQKKSELAAKYIEKLKSQADIVYPNKNDPAPAP